MIAGLLFGGAIVNIIKSDVERLDIARKIDMGVPRL